MESEIILRNSPFLTQRVINPRLWIEIGEILESSLKNKSQNRFLE